MKIIAVVNNKGGVAKSTTVKLLGRNLAALGLNVTMADCDPQSNLTDWVLGSEAGDRPPHHIGHLIEGRATVGDVLISMPLLNGRLRLLPADSDLDDTGSRMVMNNLGIFALGNVLADAGSALGDVVLLDTPPALGALTMSALLAADEIIIPTIPEPASASGISSVIRMLGQMQATVRRRPNIMGVVVTMFEHTTLHRKVLADLEAAQYRVLGVIPKRKGIHAAKELELEYSILSVAVGDLIRPGLVQEVLS